MNQSKKSKLMAREEKRSNLFCSLLVKVWDFFEGDAENRRGSGNTDTGQLLRH